MNVKEIMSRPIITEDEGITVDVAAKLMKEMEIGSLVVTREDIPVGIITERDIATKVISEDKNPGEIKLGEIMSAPLITIEYDRAIEEAAEIMAEEGIRRLPVIEKGIIVGIVSVRDILSRKPELVEKIYPKVKAKASGYTLDGIEDILTRAEQYLKGGDHEEYAKLLKEAEERLKELSEYYTEDEELQSIFLKVKQLSIESEKKDISMEKRKLWEILKELRHAIRWRKLGVTSGLATDEVPFRGYRSRV
ncbi:MAG: CBS domain-containing protein [Candidatus Syntropharchaeia archaeon]